MAEDTEAAAVPVLAAGSTFARYEIVRCVGVGGMGAVFEATHTLLRKRVALKTMHANLGRSEASRARFLREAETVARIRHPNVVDISDVGVEGGVPYLVMEFLEGEDLAHLLLREKSLSPERAVEVIVPALAGLAAVHRLGIVHRDVKPENVLLSRDPHGAIVPKLVDFGVSKDLEASLRSGSPPLHTVTGTPHYMSPEQARGSAALDGRTDQYALGIVLYQCLTGVRPYDSTSLLELIHLIDVGDFRPVRAHRPEVPAALEAVVHRAMARHPRDRYPSTEAFGRALLALCSERARLTYERDFASDHPWNDASNASLAPSTERLSAPTLAGGGAFGAGHDELREPRDLRAAPDAPAVSPGQTSSGVRVRESAEPVGVAPALISEVAPRRLSKLVVALALLGLCAAGIALVASRNHSPTPAEPLVSSANADYRLQLSVTPAQANIELDGLLVGQGRVDQVLPRDGRQHILRVTAPGHEPRSILFRDQPPAEPVIELAPLPVVPVLPEPAATPATPARSGRARDHGALRGGSTGPEPNTPALDIQLSR